MSPKDIPEHFSNVSVVKFRHNNGHFFISHIQLVDVMHLLKYKIHFTIRARPLRPQSMTPN